MVYKPNTSCYTPVNWIFCTSGGKINTTFHLTIYVFKYSYNEQRFVNGRGVFFQWTNPPTISLDNNLSNHNFNLLWKMNVNAWKRELWKVYTVFSFLFNCIRSLYCWLPIFRHEIYIFLIWNFSDKKNITPTTDLKTKRNVFPKEKANVPRKGKKKYKELEKTCENNSFFLLLYMKYFYFFLIDFCPQLNFLPSYIDLKMVIFMQTMNGIYKSIYNIKAVKIIEA